MTEKQIKIRKPYSPHARLSVTFSRPTMAKQSFKAECDINTIMSQYQKTGLITHVREVQGAYGDFSNVEGYQLSLNQVIAAQEAFDQLPAAMRKRFGNQPSQLMQFLEDPRNLEEAAKLGLVEPPRPKPEKKAPAAPAEPPEGAPSKKEGA